MALAAQRANTAMDIAATAGRPGPDLDGVSPPRTGEMPKMTSRNVNVFYGQKQALFNVDLDIPSRQVTALIGPSGCGKSTYLRCLNRMNDVIDNCRVTGDIRLDGENIYDPKLDVVMLRARIGMVFQKPNPFPKSIYDNIAYGPRIHRSEEHTSELQSQSNLVRRLLLEKKKIP